MDSKSGCRFLDPSHSPRCCAQERGAQFCRCWSAASISPSKQLRLVPQPLKFRLQHHFISHNEHRRDAAGKRFVVGSPDIEAGWPEFHSYQLDRQTATCRSQCGTGGLCRRLIGDIDESGGPVSPSIFGNLPKYGSDRLGKLSDHENHDSPTESIRICYVDTEDVSRNAHKPFHISPVPTTQEGAVYETNKIKDPLLLNKALPPYPNPKKNKHTALDQSGLKEREPVRQLTARRLKPSNWSMLNKVAEVISLRHFQRVQADEIITAQQLEETRLKRLDSQRKESSERENLIGITGSASSRLIVNSPKKLRKKPRKNARSFSLSSDKLSACKAIPAASTIMGDTVEFQQSQQIHNKDILSHPELLSKDTTRHRLQKNNGECLTNLEFKITERDKQVNRPNKDWRIARGDNELNVCTLSRSFSSSKPSFRLSSITCQQQNAYGKESTERDDNEEFAFGSAYWITTSGFEDNLVSPQCKYDENEHAHDVLQWFGTFGFGSHDQLIKDEIPSEKDSLAGTIMSTSPSTINSDVGIPIPMEPKLHNRDKSSDLVRFFRSEMRPRKNPRRRGLE